MRSEAEILAVIARGESTRTTATTKMNDASSRRLVNEYTYIDRIYIGLRSHSQNQSHANAHLCSHSVFSVTIVHKDVSRGTVKTGSMFVIDLAGSEMVKKTEVGGPLPHKRLR